MTPEMLIAAAICLPVIIAAGIAAAGKFPNLREGVTLIGAFALFAVVVQLTLLVAGGARPELYIGEAVPGLAFAFKLEPLGALFAVAGGAPHAGVALRVEPLKQPARGGQHLGGHHRHARVLV